MKKRFIASLLALSLCAGSASAGDRSDIYGSMLACSMVGVTVTALSCVAFPVVLVSAGGGLLVGALLADDDE